jgi:hypothetical protein
LTAGCSDRIRDKEGDASSAFEAGGGLKRLKLPKGAFAMIYGEPETPRFLAALQRLKKQQRKKVRQTRLAKQRVRAALRKIRPS